MTIFHKTPRRRSRAQRGQILLITSLLMITLLGMVAIVVDGGFAWGQMRRTQNGADAAAEAGAVQLMQHMNGNATVTDSTIATAVSQAASNNGVTVNAAYYTDTSGTLLRSDGSTTTATADAVRVGSGTIPRCNANCAGSDASGVRADTSRAFNTFFARVLGYTSLNAGANATAVSGYVTDACQTADGCPLLPVTVPVTVVTCDGQNNPVPQVDGSGQPIPYMKYVHYTLPLCKNGPGNVGWLDWTPPGGGASEVADNISNPQARDITLPEWYYITETGNINSSQVDNALNAWSGKVVFIPMFDSTCNLDPPGPAVDACPPPNVGGNGQNQWYHLPQVGAFLLDYPQGAFITGNNRSECAGSGGTSCLKGMFVDFQLSGTVGAAPPTCNNAQSVSCTKYYGIQLIR